MRIFMLKYLMVFVLVFPMLALYGQLDVIYKNPILIDEDRYDGIRGSSMMFDDWTNATLYDIKGLKYDNILVNYNGHSNFLEAKKNDEEYIDVDIKQIPRVIIHDVEATGVKELSFLDSLLLISRPDLDSRSSYYVVLYKDKDKILLLEYYSNISTTISHLPGETETRKRFYGTNNLVFIDGNDIRKCSSSKKNKMVKYMNGYGDYTRWCKKNKMKTNEIEAVVNFLQANP